jgi:hypothetical protein
MSKTLTAEDQLIQAIEERKTQDEKIARLRQQVNEKGLNPFMQWALRADTKKARTLKTLEETDKDMSAIEICEYNEWSLLSRFYVWTILNYACFEGSPVKRVGLGRYQWGEK